LHSDTRERVRGSTAASTISKPNVIHLKKFHILHHPTCRFRQLVSSFFFFFPQGFASEFSSRGRKQTVVVSFRARRFIRHAVWESFCCGLCASRRNIGSGCRLTTLKRVMCNPPSSKPAWPAKALEETNNAEGRGFAASYEIDCVRSHLDTD